MQNTLKFRSNLIEAHALVAVLSTYRYLIRYDLQLGSIYRLYNDYWFKFIEQKAPKYPCVFYDCLEIVPCLYAHKQMFRIYCISLYLSLYIPNRDVKPIAHYIDVIMTTMASKMTSLTVVYSTVYSDADQRKHQSSASLAFVWGIHRDRWIPHRKGQLRRKCFDLMTSSCPVLCHRRRNVKRAKGTMDPPTTSWAHKD